MYFFLKVVSVVMAARHVAVLCREAEHATPPQESPVPSGYPVVDEEVTIVVETVPAVQEITADAYLIDTGECAGSIPDDEEAGSIATEPEGEPFRKSARRTGVTELCSTGSPAMEQRCTSSQQGTPPHRAFDHQTEPSIPIVEPTVVEVRFI